MQFFVSYTNKKLHTNIIFVNVHLHVIVGPVGFEPTMENIISSG